MVSSLMELEDIMLCSTSFVPTNYLGLPLGVKYKSTLIWNAVIEKFEKNLAPWKKQYLSHEDQKQLDRIRRNFLWEANSLGHNNLLVK